MRITMYLFTALLLVFLCDNELFYTLGRKLNRAILCCTSVSIDGAFVESFIVPYNIAAHLAGVELEPAATALRRKLNRATICCTSVLQVLVQAHGMGRMTHPPLLYRPGGASTHWYHSTVDCVHGTRRPLPSHTWQISIARKSRWRRQTYWTGCL